jgi:hypothetical protein
MELGQVKLPVNILLCRYTSTVKQKEQKAVRIFMRAVGDEKRTAGNGQDLPRLVRLFISFGMVPVNLQLLRSRETAQQSKMNH